MTLDVERKLAAILSADVVGYSRLMAEDEAETVRMITAYLTREDVDRIQRLAQEMGRTILHHIEKIQWRYKHVFKELKDGPHRLSLNPDEDAFVPKF